MKKNLVVIILLFSLRPAWGAEVASDTSLGSQSFTETISADGDIAKEKGIWRFAYIYTKAITDSNGVDTSNITNEFTPGIATDNSKGFNYGLDLDFSNTASEQLRTFGPKLYSSFKFILRDGEKDFDPFLTPKLEWDYFSYVHTFGTGRRTILGKPIQGTDSIGQTKVTASLSWGVFSFLTLKALYSGYTYSKDVNQFISFLDSPRGVFTGGTGMSSTVSGFSLQTQELDFYFYLSDNWEIDLSGSVSMSASDGSQSTSSKAEVFYDFSDNFHVSLGIEKDVGSTITDNALLAGISVKL